MHIGNLQGHDFFRSNKNCRALHSVVKDLENLKSDNCREPMVTLGQLVALGQFMKKSGSSFENPLSLFILGAQPITFVVQIVRAGR